MSKQVAKHHKKAERRERADRHVKRVGGGKPTRAQKLVTREEHGVGEAYARPAPDTVEVMEIKVVGFPEDPLELDEAEPSFLQDSFFEEEE
jgi:hypothetical protein